jgi:GR25 family glycosyltransferase involved in LPS biosynthesis
MIDNIFLLNHRDLKDRLLNISTKLNKQNIKYELIQNFHPSEINILDYKCDTSDFNDVVIKTTNGSYRNFFKRITMSELSLFLKHKLCFKIQLEKKYNYILILEDDADIPDDFENYLTIHMDEFEKCGGDVLVLGECCFLKSEHDSNSLIGTSEYYKTRCTHAIIYSLKSTEKILGHLQKYNLPIDFKLNEIFQIENLKIFWTNNSILQNKSYKSEIIK